MDKKARKEIHFKWGREGNYLKLLKSKRNQEFAYRLCLSNDEDIVRCGYNHEGRYWIKAYGIPKLIEGERLEHEDFIIKEIVHKLDFGFVIFIQFIEENV